MRLQMHSNAIGAVAVIFAAVSLAGCGKGENHSSAMAQMTPAMSSVAATPAMAATPAAATSGTPDGRQLYQRCAVCHQATGQGLPGTFPPLAGSEWAITDSVALPIRVVLKGLQGPVTVKNQKFNSAMPAFGTGQPMSDADVAAVLTYVRSAWGNKASAITDDVVEKERRATASRTTPWSASDLASLLRAH